VEPMDSNVRGLDIPQAFDTYVEGPSPRQRQHREDELGRLLRWATIAPPFGAGAGSGGIAASEEILFGEQSSTFKSPQAILLAGLRLHTMMIMALCRRRVALRAVRRCLHAPSEHHQPHDSVRRPGQDLERWPASARRLARLGAVRAG